MNLTRCKPCSPSLFRVQTHPHMEYITNEHTDNKQTCLLKDNRACSHWLRNTEVVKSSCFYSVAQRMIIPVCWSTTLVQTEISQQLLMDHCGIWDLTSMAPNDWILMPFVIPWHFLEFHQQVQAGDPPDPSTSITIRLTFLSRHSRPPQTDRVMTLVILWLFILAVQLLYR